MEDHTLDSRKCVHKGHNIDLYIEYAYFRGKKHAYEVVEHRGAVVLLPITKNGTTLLVSQWRQALKEIVIELPAGLLEEGETPEDAAKRESQEEIGMYPEKLTHFLTLYSAPGFTNETLHIYLAEDLTPQKLDADETEDITVIEYTFDALLQEIKEGKIKDAKTVAAITQYLLRTS